MKSKVFVSYCHNDILADDKRLKIFIEFYISLGKGTFDILVDYQHELARVGTNIVNFMEQINRVDVVIIILTPGYKERVIARSTTGVYEEFCKIMERKEKTEKEKKYDREFVIIPIIFSGTMSSSYPEELKHIKFEDLSFLYVSHKNSEIKILPSGKPLFNQILKEISSRIFAISDIKRQQYLIRTKNLFRDFLFKYTKSQWDNPDNFVYINSAFVKTSTFKKSIGVKRVS